MLKFIAFYLPQYHPIPENDQWWGQGFTEWTNVQRGRPNFEGHRQPKIPGYLGYYSLLNPQIQEQQAKLAKESGIYGFCYYVYWFGGKRLLERPIDNLLANKKIDFPFCICWANENWTRRWDGKDDQVLISQGHSQDNDDRFILDMMKYISDPRYIRIDGRPLILVYRADLLIDSVSTTNIWRRVLQDQGFGNPYLAAVDFYNVDSPLSFGFDALVEFPPHKSLLPQNSAARTIKITNPEFSGHIFDYRKVRDWFLLRNWKGFPVFRGVMPSWDNTARRQNTPHIFADSNAKEFEQWLSAAARMTAWVKPSNERLVFINSWNEWGEGCYLEPDAVYGHQYLDAVKRVANEVEELENFIDKMTTNLPPNIRMQLAEIVAAYERSLAALRFDLNKDRATVAEVLSSEHFWLSSQGQDLTRDILHNRIRASALAGELRLRIKRKLARFLNSWRI